MTTKWHMLNCVECKQDMDTNTAVPNFWEWPLSYTHTHTHTSLWLSPQAHKCQIPKTKNSQSSCSIKFIKNGAWIGFNTNTRILICSCKFAGVINAHTHTHTHTHTRNQQQIWVSTKMFFLSPFYFLLSKTYAYFFNITKRKFTHLSLLATVVSQ